MDEKKLKHLRLNWLRALNRSRPQSVFPYAELTVETALNAELIYHLGHEKNSPKTGSNTRNGYRERNRIAEKCDPGRD